MVVAAIVAMIVNIIYVSYAFSKKRVSTIWPVITLRSITSLFVTVLFLPITELLLSMIDCGNNANGQYVLSLFEDI